MPPRKLTPSERALVEAAVAAASRSHAPYSHFHVGAALQLADGRIVPGCNVENASFGLTNCAERTALFTAMADGQRDYVAMAIFVDTPGFISPCGACRQVLFELAPELHLLLVNGARQIKRVTVRQLLPLAFGGEQLRSGQA